MELKKQFGLLQEGYYLPRKDALKTKEAKFILYGSMILYLMVCANYASYLSPTSEEGFPILPDLGFHLIPYQSLLWLTDVFVLLPTICTFLYIAVMDDQPVFSTVRIGHCLSIASILRSISVLVTGLPDPRPGCIRVVDKFFSTLVMHRCGDCIFSGHTTILATFALFWLTKSTTVFIRIEALLRSITYTSLFMGAWAILASRSHYTVDILLAIYTCTGIWFSYSYLLEVYVKKRISLVPITKLKYKAAFY